MENKFDKKSVGIVVPKTAEIKHSLSLDCGKVLEKFSLVFETYGKLNKEKSNAILICHALSGDHHAAGYHSNDDKIALEAIKKGINYVGVIASHKKAELIKVKEIKNSITAKNISFEQRREFSGAQRIGGAIFNTKLDRSHPINYGQTEINMPIFRNSTIFIEKEIDSYKNPILYTDQPLISGYISEENLKSLKSTTPVKIQGYGKGKVIYLTDNTNFRAFWYGTNKILMNAIFFGKIM